MSLRWFKKPENILALCIALTLLILHFVIIDQVKDQILDEQHYVKEANHLIDGAELDNPEHPPIGKLFLALGIWAFGDDAFGWRFFPILFGTASIILFYLVCQNLTTRRWVPLIATALFSFENQNFVQSHVAMLDVFSLTPMLAAFLLYLRGKYMSSGVMVGLSALAKLTGVFAGGIILLHWLFTRRTPIWDGVKFTIVAIVAFLALMPLFDFIAMREFHWPWDRIHEMQSLLSSLKFSNVDHPALSHPWEWLITFWKPMWFWYDPTYQACPSWTIGALIIPTMGCAAYWAFSRSRNPFARKDIAPSPLPIEPPIPDTTEATAGNPDEESSTSRFPIRGSSLCLFALIWFAGTYLSLIATDLITDRVMFKFYFFPTIGAVCLALAFVISKTWAFSSKRQNKKTRWAIRAVIIGFLLGHLAVFIVMSPYTSLANR